jgi:endo-1,4-beta-xylanase
VPAFSREDSEVGWRLERFPSRAVGQAAGYLVLVPPQYDRDDETRYPVLYWLHGLGGSPSSASPIARRLYRAWEEARLPPFLLVACTDRTGRSMWTNSADGSTPVEAIVVNELIPHVDRTFRTDARREGRAIEGFSMGGFGAAYLGFRYPELFGAVSILAGAMHTPESLRELRAGVFDEVYGNLERARQRSPWTLARENASDIRGKTLVRLFVGSEDELLPSAQAYHDLLDELAIEHEWNVIPSAGHDLALLLENWPGDPLHFYQRAFDARRARSEP